jgi:hypothetical protein
MLHRIFEKISGLSMAFLIVSKHLAVDSISLPKEITLIPGEWARLTFCQGELDHGLNIDPFGLRQILDSGNLGPARAYINRDGPASMQVFYEAKRQNRFEPTKKLVLNISLGEGWTEESQKSFKEFMLGVELKLNSALVPGSWVTILLDCLVEFSSKAQTEQELCGSPSASCGEAVFKFLHKQWSA